MGRRKTAVSLRDRLLLTLLGPMAMVLALSIYADYHNAFHLANDINDRAMNASAMQLAERLESMAGRGEISLEISDAAKQDLGATSRMQFALRDDKGHLLAGTEGLPFFSAMSGQKLPFYHDQPMKGQAMRIAQYGMHTLMGKGSLTVAQPTHGRDGTTRRIFMRSLWPNILLIIITWLVIALGVRRGLQPLHALSKHIESYSAERLPPLVLSNVPTEALGLAQAIDQLITALRRTITDQQAFLATAAHQLRTPLTALQTQLELLAAQLEGEPRARLETLLATSQQLAHFTSQMLVLAHFTQHESLAEGFSSIPLPPLLQDIASRFLDAALAKDMDLGFEAEPVVVWGSAPMLRELLANLADNAIRHNPRGTRITARCAMGLDGIVYLEVEDDGPTIAPEMQASLFTRFARGSTASRPGSGLGLAIVWEIVQRHQGTIRLQQEQGKPGKRFHVVLPPAPLGH